MSLAKVTRSKKPSRCSARRWNCTWKTSPSPITWGTRSSLRSTSPWRPRDRARPAAVEQGDDQDPGARGILGHPHRGSHCKLRHQARTVIVPLGRDPLKLGTQADILRQAGITADHLQDFL